MLKMITPSYAPAAAVANALPMSKENADLVLAKAHRAGIVELIDRTGKTMPEWADWHGTD
jgi:hypothetical protein